MAMRARAPAVPFTLAWPNAAGIDIGAASHWVAVPAERDAQPVREFATFSGDLVRLAEWLAACGVDAVAMESTGVYWIPLYELLEARGVTVFLVNARSVRNVSGRKSDVLDCQWLQQLMSYGLLSAAYRPAGEICALRSVVRQRSMLLQYQARHVQHVQKALTQMNVQLGCVLADVMGATGQAIVRAIAAGERDARRLAALRDGRVKASEEQIAAALQGNWREEHLFALTQALALYDAYQQQLAACDAKLQEMLARLGRHASEPPGHARSGGRPKNAPRFDVRRALYQMAGVDLTAIAGIEVSTALVVLSEIGVELQRFKTVKQFCAWLGLAPGTRISGGKVLSAKALHSANRVSQALRLAAANLRTSRTALGAYYRRMCARMDKPKAITAAAHKLARIIYAMLTRGQAYVEAGQDSYEQHYRQRVLANLKRRARELGFELQPAGDHANA